MIWDGLLDYFTGVVQDANINYLWVWRLKYSLGEILDCSISQAGIGEGNGQFIFHWVDMFQPSNEYICFISLLHKFHDIIYNYLDFKMTFRTTKNFGVLCCGLKLIPIMINRRVLACARMRCVQTFDSFCFQNELSNGDSDS